MAYRSTEKIGFFVLLVALLAGGLLVLWPFIETIVLGAAFTILFKPLHLKYLHWTRGRENASSVLSVASVFVFLLIPITTIFALLTSQISGLVTALTKNLRDPTMSGFLTQIETKFGLRTMKLDLFGMDLNLGPFIKETLEKVAVGLAGYTPHFVEDTFAFFMHLFILTIVLFYFFKEGDSFFKLVVRMTPVKDQYEINLAKEFKITVRGVFYGSFLTALIQAVLALLGFYFIGIDGYLVWAALTFCMAFLPMIGTAAILLPMTLYLIAQGETRKAWFLVIYGACVIGLVDNFLKPLLIESNVHPLFLFLSVFGGLVVFGPAGLLFGPMLMALLTAALAIYARDFEVTTPPRPLDQE